jgi:hypothetical protein
MMSFTYYGIEIPLWALFSLALIGLVTCVFVGTVAAVGVIKWLIKPAWRQLSRTPV